MTKVRWKPLKISNDPTQGVKSWGMMVLDKIIHKHSKKNKETTKGKKERTSGKAAKITKRMKN